MLVLLGSEEDEDEGEAGRLIVAVFAFCWNKAADSVRVEGFTANTMGALQSLLTYE